jgi:hypothetical protein
MGAASPARGKKRLQSMQSLGTKGARRTVMISLLRGLL